MSHERRVGQAIKTLASELRAAEDKHADDEDRLRKWGFGMTPSERRRLEEKIEAGEERLTVCRRAAGILEESQ